MLRFFTSETAHKCNDYGVAKYDKETDCLWWKVTAEKCLAESRRIIILSVLRSG
jgi:hypothetical protein